MPQDMTKGNSLSLIIRFTIPVLIGNLFQQFYNVMDSIIVGRFLGVDALAAIGVTGSLVFLVIGWVNGMTSGFAILVAQSFGAGDEKSLRHYVAMSTYLCIAMAVLMTAGLLIANEPILRLMNTPEEIMADTKAYVATIYAGLTVTIMYNMLAGFSRSLGDSKTPLYFLVLSSVLNIGLDILFITTFQMGVAGAGYATVISQAVSAVLCLIYVWKKYKILHFGREDAGFSIRSAGKLLNMGLPMGLQFSITAIGTMIVQSSLNLLGSVYIAGYSAAGKIQNMIIQVFPAMGVTVATFVGQNTGAGQYKRIRQGVRQSQIIVLICAVVLGVFIYFGGAQAVLLFVDDTTGEVRQVAREMFHLLPWFYPFLGSIFLYRNALQGIGDGLVPMLGGVFELVARGVVIALLAEPLGFFGICISDPAAWVMALIPIVPVYLYRMKKIEGRSQEKNSALA